MLFNVRCVAPRELLRADVVPEAAISSVSILLIAEANSNG